MANENICGICSRESRTPAEGALTTTRNSAMLPPPVTYKSATINESGGSITQPTDALCEFILDQGWTDIQMNRIEWSFTPRGAGSGNAAGGETGTTPISGNSHHRKYVCPCCGNSVRATKAVNILCIDCGRQMVQQ